MLKNGNRSTSFGQDCKLVEELPHFLAIADGVAVKSEEEKVNCGPITRLLFLVGQLH